VEAHCPALRLFGTLLPSAARIASAKCGQAHRVSRIPQVQSICKGSAVSRRYPDKDREQGEIMQSSGSRRIRVEYLAATDRGFSPHDLPGLGPVMCIAPNDLSFATPTSCQDVSSRGSASPRRGSSAPSTQVSAKPALVPSVTSRPACVSASSDTHLHASGRLEVRADGSAAP